tara:strand:+ start:284 stop:475 length:192 start_codon:yes stop_codon:yes gene_type:complete
MIQDLKDKLEREKSKNKVLLQILEDTQKCITNGKKFLDDKPVVIAKIDNPFIRKDNFNSELLI